MTASDREYQEALAYVRAKLALPKSEREKWLNEIVDMWIANRRARRHRKNTR